jgi:ribosomal protein L11 methyltransferase
VSTPPDWATLRIVLDPPLVDREKRAHAADLLDELGAIIAGWPLVGGVETRDPTTANAPESPELWAYTVPEALGSIERRIRGLCHRLGLEVTFHPQIHQGDSWRDAWRQFYAPIVLGNGALLLRPSWVARRPLDPEVEVVIDPGRAFGTGLHASTRLCLDHLCRLAVAQSDPPERILDVGCGSGILTLVAAQLWPAALVAMDTDPEATATTSENLAKNRLDHRVQVVTGRLEDAELSPPFDLVVANIRPTVLAPMAPLLARHRTRDGVLVLSGILDEEGDDVAAAYAAVGLPEAARHHRDGWCLLQLGGRHP